MEAFIKNHKKTKQPIDEIYSKCKDKNKLVETLVAMFRHIMLVLMTRSDEGNVEWK